ncbi:MAG: hypothetical protein RLZZ414_1078 [Bacteroidota bacterium]
MPKYSPFFHSEVGNYDAAIHSVIGTYNWTPKTIDSLYCDDTDYFGIWYYYFEIKRQQEELKKDTKK